MLQIYTLYLIERARYSNNLASNILNFISCTLTIASSDNIPTDLTIIRNTNKRKKNEYKVNLSKIEKTKVEE